MPRPLSAAARTALRSSTVAVIWLLTLETAEGTLRISNVNRDISFGGNTYEAGQDKWFIQGQITTGSGLIPEPITVAFDGSERFDDADFVGRLLDRTWHQRAATLEGILADPETGAVIDSYYTWRGRMDTLTDGDALGGVSQVIVSLEGGTFRALDRNYTTCGHNDHRRRDSNDHFFQNTGSKASTSIPFGTRNVDIAGEHGVSRARPIRGVNAPYKVW